ncbi:MAG: ATP-dependent Clp protease ATP-binding subunit [Bacillota bacterium]
MEGFYGDIAVVETMARALASARGECVRTDHIIQSILQCDSCTASIILKKLKINSASFAIQNGYNNTIGICGSEVAANIAENILISADAKSAYTKAKILAYQCESDSVQTHHLLLAISQDEGCRGAVKLAELGVTHNELLPIVSSINAMKMADNSEVQETTISTTKEEQDKRKEIVFPTEWGYDLTAEVVKLNVQICGRDKEITRITNILHRKSKNNVLLIGEAGVGKTAVAEGVALALYKNNGKRIFSLDVAGLMGGAKYRGDCEERLKKLFLAIKDSGAILFIDEIHTIMSAGDKEGGMTIANLLKPMLARDGLCVIGATTHDEYRRYLAKDSALTRRFQLITIEAPSAKECINMIRGSVKSLEEYHKISITKDAVTSAVELSERFIKDRQLPDKALDIIDEACAITAAKGVKRLTKSDIVAIIEESTGIPQSTLTAETAKQLQNIGEILSTRIVGQDEAIAVVSKAVRRTRSHLRQDNKPINSMLFIGSTGVGKTATAVALAELIFGNKNALIRLDMSEFMEKHSISRIIGAPIGYIGYEDGNTVADAITRHPYSVLLLDEIEKAHSDVLNILLQILDAGRLTDTHNRVCDCTNLIVIMTSNIGVSADKTVGFISNSKTTPLVELKRVMRPELINRIDDIVVFKELSQQAQQTIVERGLKTVVMSLKKAGITLTYKEEVTDWIVEKSQSKEARALNRVIKSKVEDTITRLLQAEPRKTVIELKVEYDQIICN